jgi:hypothetical protein
MKVIRMVLECCCYIDIYKILQAVHHENMRITSSDEAIEYYSFVAAAMRVL